MTEPMFEPLPAPVPGPRRVVHSVVEVEDQLGRLWAHTRNAARAAGEADLAGEHHVTARSSVVNLVVLAGHREVAERCASIIATTGGRHPSRSLILSTVDADGPAGFFGWVEALSPSAAGRPGSGAETVNVIANGETGRHLASIIVPLLAHDLPVALWWPHDPNFRSHRADRLLPLADRLIVDGSSWSGNGLDRLESLARLSASASMAVVDFSLLRQARWREAVASVYDLPDLRPHLRAVRSIKVDYSAPDGDETGLTNVVRPIYHVAWLASRLGMSVTAPLTRSPDGSRRGTLRQGDHTLAAVLNPVAAPIPSGSTVCVEIVSRRREGELVGVVTAGDLTVDVVVSDNGRERARRSYNAPRLTDVDLLIQAVDETIPDPLSRPTLAMARRLLGREKS